MARPMSATVLTEVMLGKSPIFLIGNITCKKAGNPRSITEREDGQ
jgi:hypothetical protein